MVEGRETSGPSPPLLVDAGFLRALAEHAEELGAHFHPNSGMPPKKVATADRRELRRPRARLT